MAEKRYRGPPGAHYKIESEEAEYLFKLAKEYYPERYTYSSKKDRQIAKKVNSVWHHRRTERDISSFLRHIEECSLTSKDFIDF